MKSKEFWGVAVPGLVTGIGTLALALVTVLLANQERSRNDRLRREDQARDEMLRHEDRLQLEADRVGASRRNQAERVSAWAGEYTQHRELLPYELHKTHKEEEIKFGAIVRNLSDLPVWDVEVFWHLGGGAYNERIRTDVVPPGEDRHQPVFNVAGVAEGDISLERISTMFRDAAGITWTRDADGKLTEGPFVDGIRTTETSITKVWKK